MNRVSRLGWGRRAMLLALVLAAGSAGAQPNESEVLQLQYAAPDGCPDAAYFQAQVAARTRRIRFAAPNEAGSPVDVTVSAPEGRAVAVLRLPNEDGTESIRQVSAPSCLEAVVAVSLVLAIRYDPDAALRPPEATSVPTPAPQPTPPPATLLLRPRPVPLEQPPSARVGLDLGGGLSAMGGVTPEIEPLIGVFAEGRVELGEWLTPSVGIWLSWVPESDVPGVAQNRQASIGYAGGRIAACANLEVGSSRVLAAPCFGVDAGRIAGEGGDGVDEPLSQARLWFALTPFARLRWIFSRPFFMEVAGGAGFTMTPRWEFTLSGPDETRHVVPAVYGYGGAAMGVHL